MQQALRATLSKIALRFWLTISVSGSVLLPACQPAADEQPAPRPVAPATLTVADARGWYETARLIATPPTTPTIASADGSVPSTYGPPVIRWSQAVQLAHQGETLVLAPIADTATTFAVSGHQSFRYLVTFRATGQSLGGFVLEVLRKGPARSPAQMEATVLQLYEHYRRPRAAPRPALTGYAYFYSVGYDYWGGIEFRPDGSIRPARLYQVEAATTARGGRGGKCMDYYTQPGGQGTYLGSSCPIPVAHDGPVGGGPRPPGYIPDPYGGSGPNPGEPTYPGGGGGGSTPPVVPQIITDPSITNNEKANCIYTKLLNNSNFRNLLVNFHNNTQYNVRFSLGNAGGNTGITSWNYNTSTAEITISADALGYQHAIWGAATFFHEAFHANLQQHAIATFGNFEINSWPKSINDMTLKELVTFVDASAIKNQAWSTATHNFMASNVTSMSVGLRIFVQSNYPTTYAQIGNNPDAYKALALMGLENSRYWASSTNAQQQEYLRLMNEFVTSELPDCTK